MRVRRRRGMPSPQPTPEHKERQKKGVAAERYSPSTIHRAGRLNKKKNKHATEQEKVCFFFSIFFLLFTSKEPHGLMLFRSKGV